MQKMCVEYFVIFLNLSVQMYRAGNYPPNGHGAPPLAPNPNMPQPPSNNNNANNGRGGARSDNRNAARPDTTDDLAHRPIIKEEDLSRMDDMTRDMGWATHDDIDYK